MINLNNVIKNIKSIETIQWTNLFAIYVIDKNLVLHKINILKKKTKNQKTYDLVTLEMLIFKIFHIRKYSLGKFLYMFGEYGF